MDILTPWLRSCLPALPVTDEQLAEDLTLRGIAVEGTFPIAGGMRYEMDITTNRVDAMNHYGVAREAAAIYDVPLAPLPATAPIAADKPGDAFPVTIEAQDLCGRFTARVIRGITVSTSKGTISKYFEALGQKPISGPVDVTNFGWLSMGQPTHVFDLDTLEGGIVVRRAEPGEKLRLLDGSEHTLVADDLVVADDKKALGLAGVMGGWDSRVTETTKNILVEAAWFDPAAIRASSRRHGLHTDASHRFERGADLAAAPLANNLVTRLVLEQAGGEVVGEMTDVIVPALAAKTADRPTIALRVGEVQRHLGTTLEDQAANAAHAIPSGTLGRSGLQPGKSASQEEGVSDPERQPSHSLNAALVERYLTALGCTLTQTAPGEYAVKLPSWRLDLEREIDLIEEVARVYGYNKFANTLPTFTGTVIEFPHAAQEQSIRSTLRGLGFSEVISSTFCSAEEAMLFIASPAVAIGNPLSAEAGMLRPALAPGMATMIADNLHRDVATVRLFEMGTVFKGSTAEVKEHTGLSLGLTGSAIATSLYKADDALFYELKGALEALLAKFTGTGTFDTSELPTWIAAGRGARALIDGKPFAVFGELSTTEQQRRKLRQTVALAEVDASALLATALRQAASSEISRFQAVERDFSFILSDSVRWIDIDTSLRALNIAELRSIAPVEIFRDAKGKAVAAGSYSLLVRVVFQSTARTLAEEDLTGNSARIVAALTALGGIQRA